MMKVILLIFLFLGVETSCRNNTVTPLKAETPERPVIDTSFRPLTEEEKAFYTQQAKSFYSGFLNSSSFNGSILVAKNGQIIMEKYQGMANFSTREPIDANTAFHLASVSKTFTAMAVLHLWEQQQLSLDDDVRKYFPSFPYYGITVRMLLTHRSGLPNYAYFMKTTDRSVLFSNDDVINYMIAYRPQESARPDAGFQYCNTNYVLLAGIIEKVTGRSYPDYMRDEVFRPLGLNHTFVCTRDNLATVPVSYTAGNRPYNIENFDGIYGDKNIYSTVRDLLTWDKVLYTNSFVKQETAAMAYQGYSNEKPGIHNYGMGWRLIDKDDIKVVYHTGWWHGNCNIFTRVVQDTATVIILSNRYNSQVFRSKNTASVFAKSLIDASKQDMSEIAAGGDAKEQESR
ncbi:MAG TPA: serine hydrolase domain-containing protein [Chitinophagaceae bacterium]